MRSRPPVECPPTLRPKLARALEAMEGLPAKEQLEFACHLVTAVLQLARPRFEKSQGDHAAFDYLCGVTLAQVQTAINRLRFAKPH